MKIFKIRGVYEFSPFNYTEEDVAGTEFIYRRRIQYLDTSIFRYDKQFILSQEDYYSYSEAHYEELIKRIRR